MQQKKINLFFRKKSPTSQSIEMLFDNIIVSLSKTQDKFELSKKELPNYSSSIYDFLKNIFFAFNNQTDINHITGDIHYIFFFLNRKRTIITIHDCILLKHKKESYFYWLYKLIWYDLPMRYCKKITTISEKSKQELIHYIKIEPHKIHVIDNFYDPIFQFSLNEFNKEYPVFLQVGTTPNKNLETLIDVLAGFKCHIMIVGELSENQIHRLKTAKIDFSSFLNIPKQHLFELYKKADIITFISTYEGFGLPLIEGNAVGRVVISSHLSPMKEVGKDSAQFVDPFDKKSIRDGIEKVIYNDKHRDLLINNGKKNAQRFRLEEVAKKYLDLYETI